MIPDYRESVKVERLVNDVSTTMLPKMENMWIPSEEPTYEPTDDDYEDLSQYIKHYEKPLWKRFEEPSLMIEKKHNIACTINVQPTRFMNKRQWKKYSHDQQKAILNRIENAMRRVYPTIVLKKLYYEICPILNNIHFHAWYVCTMDDEQKMKDYFEQRCGTPKGTQTKPWRMYLSKYIYDEQGWVNYITKDQNLPVEQRLV